jgi:hypothetical protein
MLEPVAITMPDASISSLTNCKNFTASYTGSGRLPFLVRGRGFLPSRSRQAWRDGGGRWG